MYVWDPKVQPAMDQQWNLTVQTKPPYNHVPTRLCRPAWNPPDGSNALSCRGRSITASLDQAYFSPVINLLINDISQRIRDRVSRFHDLQRPPGRVAKAPCQWSGRATRLHLVALPDQQQRLLWHRATPTRLRPASPYYQNLYDPHADYASCYYDARNIVRGYATYDLPFGKGKTLGNNMNPVLNAVVGNWQASTIISLHSGFPVAVYNATDTSQTDSRGPRPNCGFNAVLGRQPSTSGAPSRAINGSARTDFPSRRHLRLGIAQPRGLSPDLVTRIRI